MRSDRLQVIADQFRILIHLSTVGGRNASTDNGTYGTNLTTSVGPIWVFEALVSQVFGTYLTCLFLIIMASVVADLNSRGFVGGGHFRFRLMFSR